MTKWMKFEDRITQIAERPDKCWVWPWAKSTGGYGRAWVNGRLVQAHRAIYEMIAGSIQDGMELDHLCRNRACVNPAHLEPVTTRENLLRGTGASARNARKTQCPQGHPYDATNTIIVKTGRQCRACSYERQRLYRSVPKNKERKAEYDKARRGATRGKIP